MCWFFYLEFFCHVFFLSWGVLSWGVLSWGVLSWGVLSWEVLSWGFLSWGFCLLYNLVKDGMGFFVLGGFVRDSFLCMAVMGHHTCQKYDEAISIIFVHRSSEVRLIKLFEFNV